MKLRVIHGEKGKKQEEKNQMPVAEKPSTAKTSKSQNAPQSSMMEDYYAKDRPRAQEMEQAEGDEDIVDEALKHQSKAGDAA